MYLKPVIAIGALALAGAAQARDITDMVGRTVTVPDKVESVVTLGSVPVINSFIFATGNADLIASDLPPWARNSPRWALQDVFAPHLAQNVRVEDAERNLDLESVITLDPDLAITFARDIADLLEANGIPTIVPQIQTPEEVKATVALMGELFGNGTVGDDYAAWFDSALSGVEERLAGVEQRPTVLYLNPTNMTQPHLVAEWWIAAGGGESVTDDGRSTETLSLSTETVLAADPDILILDSPASIRTVNDDPNLSTLTAVREGRVLVTPVGAHIWANRTVEQPLTVLWAASQFHPDLFPEAEFFGQVRDFYATFFKTELGDDQIRGILAGEGGTS